MSGLLSLCLCASPLCLLRSPRPGVQAPLLQGYLVRVPTLVTPAETRWTHLLWGHRSPHNKADPLSGFPHRHTAEGPESPPASVTGNPRPHQLCPRSCAFSNVCASSHLRPLHVLDGQRGGPGVTPSGEDGEEPPPPSATSRLRPRRLPQASARAAKNTCGHISWCSAARDAQFRETGSLRRGCCLLDSGRCSSCAG